MSFRSRLHTSTDSLSSEDILRWTRVGVLASFAMLLSYFETFIPIPIPGIKLGLANIAILVVLGLGDIRGAFCVAVIKVLAAGFLFGNPLTIAYSAAGTLLAFLGMAPLSCLKTMRIEMVSIVGALLHEAGQLVVASVLLGTWLVWYSAPLFLVAGCITGLLCGVVAQQIMVRISSESAKGELVLDVGADVKTQSELNVSNATILPKRNSNLPTKASSLNLFTSAEVAFGGQTGSAAENGGKTHHQNFLQLSKKHAFPKVILVLFLVYALVALHVSSWGLLACVVVMLFCCIAARVSPYVVVSALKPLVFILVLTAIMQVINYQSSAPLLTLGPVVVSYEALKVTLEMMLRVICIVGMSLAFMSALSLPQLVESVRWLLSPLKRLGVKTEGFVLALDTAIQFVPVLASQIDNQHLRKPTKLLSKEFWKITLPELIASSMQECLQLANQQISTKKNGAN